MGVCIIIPARLNSSRLPQKILADIKGKPMIQHVYERALQIRGVSEVVVAADHEQTLKAVSGFGGKAVLTPSALPSGTDRVAFVAQSRSEKIIVNIQGDEPLINPKTVEAAIELVASGQYNIATAAAPISSEDTLKNPNVVKVLVGAKQQAVYFSRFPIPYSRKLPSGSTLEDTFICRAHQGLYIYKRETLLEYADLPQCPWEQAESLEQLRALYYGIAIGVAHAEKASQAVDTLEDLECVRKKLA